MRKKRRDARDVLLPPEQTLAIHITRAFDAYARSALPLPAADQPLPLGYRLTEGKVEACVEDMSVVEIIDGMRDEPLDTIVQHLAILGATSAKTGLAWSRREVARVVRMVT